MNENQKIQGPGLLVLLLFICNIGIAQSSDLVAVDKVASDFTRLLQRPATPFRPSFEITRTDSVIIDKGFIYSDQRKDTHTHLQTRS